MAKGIQAGYSNYVRFLLVAETNTGIVIEEPLGWKEDELELSRNDMYHGIFFQFTGGLKFYGDGKVYIKDTYDALGVNAKLLLVKQVLRDVGGTVKFVTEYSGYADFTTMVETEYDLSINFNSYDLANIMKSHEKDDMEIERITDIDGGAIDAMEVNTITLKDRGLSYGVEHEIKPINSLFPDEPKEGNAVYYDLVNFTPLTELLISVEDESRNASVDDWRQPYTSSNFFYQRGSGAEPTDYKPPTVNIRYKIEVRMTNYGTATSGTLKFERYLYDENDNDFSYVSTEDVQEMDVDVWNVLEGEFQVTDVLWNEALLFKMGTLPTIQQAKWEFRVISLVVQEDTFFPDTPNVRVAFVHDIADRLMLIMTGRKDAFYSKYFGRTGIIDTDGTSKYEKDGEKGLVALTSGLWARGFAPDSEKYKSLTTNLNELLVSLQAVFNVGIGIDNVGAQERLRIEDLRYFYQDKTVVKLPNIIANVTRRVSADMFFSGTTLGYERGGDYSDTMGLDEPNTKSNWITPIRKSENKYEKSSKIRADEYGLEETRRKPQSEFPYEDTKRDEANWFLDLKRGEYAGFEQVQWGDRLDKIPSGINNPEKFRSMMFTPQQILFRHGWIIRSGMEKYQESAFTFGSTKANKTLTMQFTGKEEYSEGQDLKVSNLDRSRLVPEMVEFQHEVTDELMDELMGFTEITYDGSNDIVRNFYFKIEYTNEFGETERGYLMELKPNGVGNWVVLKANEENI